MNHTVLSEPQIPANTGNIARICAATDTLLRLIESLGLSTDDKHLKRTESDYWNDVNITYHKDSVTFLAHVAGKYLYLVVKLAHQTYSEVNYNDGEDHYSLFEKKTMGLSETFMREDEEKCIRIPMNDEHVRLLSLSNTAALVVHETLRR